MICIFCHGRKTKVGETRVHKGSVYRRRLCACGKAFVTQETAPPDLRMPVEVNSSDARGQRLERRR